MSKIILDANQIGRILVRLSHEIEEKNEGTDELYLVGIKRGGEVIARRLQTVFAERGVMLPCTGISIGMYRDDLVSAFFVPEAERNDFSPAGKKIILCDDILHTGRSVRAAIEAIFELGRPQSVQLLELVDRGGRELPVRADYVGKNVPTSREEYLAVDFVEYGGSDSITIEKKR
ncbi:MAG: bifunctional pyr operon transcriptional regulator/uracil phosphoribosyltransferase PyrR [Christensenellaceae bacterium]